MRTKIKTIKMYLHGCKESNLDTADELGLSEEAAQKFKYALYEIEFDVTIFDDGTYVINYVQEGDQVYQ